MTAIGRYRVLGELARGSSAVVYRCADPERPDVTVAVKRVDRFDPRTRSLDHPNVVAILDDFVDGPHHVVVMGLLEGPSLAEVAAAGRRITAGEVRGLLAGLTSGLVHIHGVGLVHGDISPANVVAAAHGPVLVDVAASGTRSGTPGFVDASVAAGAPAGVHTDVYGLGALAFHAITGRPPAPGERVADVVPGFDPTVAAVVDRAIAPRRSDRFATAAEMESALALVPSVRKDDRREDTGPAAGPVLCVTRSFGFGPPASGPEPRVGTDGAARRSPVVMAGAGALVAIAALLLAVVPGRIGGPADAAETAQSVSCPPPAPVPSLPGQTIFWADVRGTGCPSPVAWAAGVIAVALVDGRPPSRFRLGQPDDQVVLGDWFCRDRDTPALYRPGTGEVWYFGSWARPGDPLASELSERTGIANATAHLATTGPTHHAQTPRCARVDLRSGTPSAETP